MPQPPTGEPYFSPEERASLARMLLRSATSDQMAHGKSLRLLEMHLKSSLGPGFLVLIAIQPDDAAGRRAHENAMSLLDAHGVLQFGSDGVLVIYEEKEL